MKSAEDHQLPKKKDFDPWHGDLDARWAWDQFGGLSIDQAYGKFIKNPEIHQEDFMFMGPKAFLYYFPVIERYITNVQLDDPDDDESLWIIGCALKSQYKKNPKVLKAKIKKLTYVTLKKIGTSKLSNEEKKRCAGKWKEIKKLIYY